jgi:SAM-dependent methyltransferase
VEVAAGTGRLTCLLEARPGRVVAVEPAAALRALLRRRLPDTLVTAGLGQALPLAAACADLVVSCASFGPDAPLGGERVLAELERCAAPGGAVALVGPEQPDWFAARGYTRITFPAEHAAMPPDLVDFFGPRLQPPADLLLKRL